MVKRIMILGLLVSLLFTACQKPAETSIKIEFVGKRNVQVAKVIQGDISSFIEFSGKLAADETVNIAPALSAKIIKILVDEGSVVKKGDLLAKLDQTQLLQAKTQFNNAEKNYQRMLELKKTGAIDGVTFDEVESAYKLAKTNLDFMAENILINAPQDGVITKVFKKEGENYDAMMDPFLMRMVNLDKIKANIQVSDADINSVKIGQKAVLNVNSSPDEFFGEVTFISPEADLMTGTFPVEITVNNRNNLLRNNQFAHIKLLISTSENTLIIPQKCVLNENIVFTVKDGKAIKNYIEPGIQNEYQVEVKSGIAKDALVITVGNIGLSHGDPVEIVKE